ncbi:sodium:proton antiporter [Mucilaginibacter sp. Bleaf8]|uniref:cation:proton antiporter n=1 Tax=Mucilaginibacter sp. Bleaf8 TaxID=2834430 RepID=UPI001BCA80A6|nr:sodium:proton antiporter [Mucilaginibacter sp. Bleaf8]MBS7564819.1 sodium:proton antiporter [Mucilaginibacter sp. Bleaf8]
MEVFEIVTLLFGISTLFSFINARWIKLPGVIGVMLLAIVAAIITLVAGKAFPLFTNLVLTLSDDIDFSKTVLDILLGFLLFASALHFDVNKLRENMRSVLTISTIGVIISAMLFAGMLYYVTGWFDVQLPAIYCMIFGALIAPTDAVAVSALLKESKMPSRLETIISGESLFNDGIGIVLFISFLDIATIPGKSFSFGGAALLFAQEVFGGLLLGGVLGWVAYRMMRVVNDFQTIVLISITLVMAICLLSGLLHVSIPLAAVAAGLLVGSRCFDQSAADPKTGEYLGRIWKLIDDLLNTLLFVLIGLQMVTVSFTADYLWIGFIAVFVLLLARLLSILLPVILLRRTLHIHLNNLFILTWGGLRGGISVALALSLPDTPYRELIITASFFIVVFSVICQGLTLNKVVNRLIG